jgi:hypothetical protein
MKGNRDTGPRSWMRAVTRSVDPVRAIVVLCATVLFLLPFLAVFSITRSTSFWLYLLFPLGFLLAHAVWFRLPAIGKRILWALFWVGLTAILAFGAGFLFWSCQDAAARGVMVMPSWLLAVPHWLYPSTEVSLSAAAAYLLLPSALVAAAYCLLLGLFLRVYEKYVAEERRRRTTGRGRKV